MGIGLIVEEGALLCRCVIGEWRSGGVVSGGICELRVEELKFENILAT